MKCIQDEFFLNRWNAGFGNAVILGISTFSAELFVDSSQSLRCCHKTRSIRSSSAIISTGVNLKIDVCHNFILTLIVLVYEFKKSNFTE